MTSASGKPIQKRKVRSKKRAIALNTAAALTNEPTTQEFVRTATTTNSDWIEMFPHGISVNSEVGRPVFILKDQSAVEVLPVWVNPLDAGVALAELSQHAASSPHAVTRRLLESLGMRLDSCTFVDLVGHHQFVNLTFVKGGDKHHLRVRADEAMSFCLQGRAKFFATKAYMHQCRALDADLSRLEQNMVAGQVPQLENEGHKAAKKHPYLM